MRGIDYHVTEWGDNDAIPVVYLHGWGDTGSTLQLVADSLDAKWRLIAPDWRGFGRSAWSRNGYWFPDYLADLDALLHEYMGATPALLIGHSMGANVAALYAGTRPERVRGFVNIEGFGLPDSSADDAPTRYRQWLKGWSETRPAGIYGSYEELAKRIMSRNPRMRSDHALFVSRAWAMDEEGKVRLRMDPLHRLPNPVLYRRSEAKACWQEITAEVALVVGTESPFAGAAEAWLKDGRLRDRAGLEKIDGAGHMLHFDTPAELGRVLDRCLAQWV